ncbi:MAG: RNA methyltransferase [Actinobacteria bacterium]|nr:RNA methyltransferase [Actinomycetota bacterium]
MTAALEAGAPVEAVFVGPGADEAVVTPAVDRGIRRYDVDAGVIERIADTVTPQPVLAVVGFVDQPLDCLENATFVVVCAGVGDPGNTGTILRSAEAAGADGVVCGDGSVDVYNPKAVRASAGSLFHVPIVAGGDPVDVVDQLGRWGLTTIAAVAHGGTDPVAVDLRQRVAVVVGNEATGLAAPVEQAAAVKVTIPIRGRAESLNVGMATAVLAFEVARQRR